MLCTILDDPRPRWRPMMGTPSNNRPVIYADAFFLLGEKKTRSWPNDVPWEPKTVSATKNGWGCVIIPDQSRPHEGVMIRGEIPADVVAAYCSSKAYIYFLEALAQIIPVVIRPDLIQREYIAYIDNEAAKHALVKGYGSVKEVNNLVSAFWRFCEHRTLMPWFERVSTQANVSDAISRDDLSDGFSRGWTLFDVDLTELFDKIRKIAADPTVDFSQDQCGVTPPNTK